MDTYLGAVGVVGVDGVVAVNAHGRADLQIGAVDVRIKEEELIVGQVKLHLGRGQRKIGYENRYRNVKEISNSPKQSILTFFSMA